MKIFFCIIFVVFSALILSAFTFKQQADPNKGLVFYSENTHDALWHLALLESIDQRFPPLNPVLSGEPLRGYHYVFDALLVIIHRLTGLSFLFLYLKLAPVLLTAFFAFTTLLLFNAIFKNAKVAFLGAGLTILGANFAYLAPLFFPVKQTYQSIFWLDQPIHLAINQQLLLALALCNLIWWALWISPKKYWMLIGVLTGLLTGIKIYATFLFLPALAVVGFFTFWRQKETALLKSTFLATVIAFCLILLIGSQSNFPFFWEPGWFFKTMFEGGDRLNFSRWELMRLNAAEHNNILRLFILWTGATVIFFVGNFGVKILGLCALPFLKKEFHKDRNIFWLMLILVLTESFLMPSFFLQTGVAWNTIQFLHFGLIPLTLLLVWGVNQFTRLRVPILIVLLILALPTTFTTIINDLQPSAYSTYYPQVSSDLAVLRSTHLDKEILLDPRLSHWSMVPALSGRAVYWADPTVQSILGTDPDREEYQLAVLTGEAACKPTQIWLRPNGYGITVEPCPLLPICYP